MTSKYFILGLVCLCSSLQEITAQVGVGNTEPKASLDISSSSLTNPNNTDGILIPRIDNFPSANPTIDQDGMMVFATGNGTPTKGFYYWDNSSSSWIPVVGVDTKNTLDGAYDEGGAGAGKAVTADNGAVSINGTDGFLVTGTFGNGNSIDNEVTGNGIRMFFYPAKGAFRAGWADGNQWDDINIGNYSFAGGNRSLASGTYSTVFGYDNVATGSGSFATGINGGSQGDYSASFGYYNYANGDASFSYGSYNEANGENALAGGNSSRAYGDNSFAIGNSITNGDYSFSSGNGLTAASYGEVVFGLFSTNYSANSTTSFNISDRIFTVGNGQDFSNRSNALTIYKNGLININDAYNMPLTDGTLGQVLTTDGSGNLSFQNTIGDGDTQNTLNDAYNEGGAGAGKNINASNGAVRVDGTDGFLVTGTLGSGNSINTEITGAGTRMFFNPNKAAFRAGAVSGNQWDNANIGIWSVGFGVNTIASGTTSTAFGSNSIASGNSSTAFGATTTASGSNSTAFGQNTTASGNSTIAFGVNNVSSGTYSFVSGSFNTSPSYSETVIGSYATQYTPVSTGAFNAADKLFVIGNGTSNANRRNALTIYKSGLMNINDAYNMPFTDGTMGQVMTTDGAGSVSFQNIVGDGTGTDNQNLTTATLTGTTLNLGIQNGTGTSVDLASIANDNDWVSVGPNIERQSGDVYIGNTNTTNNDLIISNNIVDWDNTNYYINPDDLSVVDEIQFDNGTTVDPSIRFSDINTGFFSPYNGAIAYTAFGSEAFRVQSDGELSIGLTGATDYKFSLNSLVNQNSIRMGNDVTSLDDFVDIEHGAQRGNALSISVNSSYTLASRSGISLFNNQGDVSVDMAKYTTGSNNAYGMEINIPDDIGGVEYGVYSNVLTSNGFAAYFLGEVSLGTTTANAYILPNSRGTNGQIMQTDGFGNVTWQDPTIGTDNQQVDTFTFNATTSELSLEIEDDGQPAQVVDLSSLNPQKAIARMYMSASQTETGGGITKVNFDSSEFDVGNNFNATTDEFTIPQTGFYRITTQITIEASTGTGVFDVRIRVNGSQQRRTEFNHTGNGQIVRQVSSILNLTAGDTIDVAFSRPAVGATIQANSRATFFEIEQLN
ncbi:MAG: hypothetical protein GYB32_08860 [Algicola sp.]|nr:hypothetical protein [Algicola sp.]